MQWFYADVTRGQEDPVIIAARDRGSDPKTGGDAVNIEFADRRAASGLATSANNRLGKRAAELAVQVEGKGYHQGDTLSKGWNNGRFLDPQEISYFDCSGLVYWSYNRAWEMITGNRIPHYSTWYEDNNCVNEAPHPVFYLGASGQWKDTSKFEQLSTKIPTVDDLKTGYLLFLDTDSNGFADHVGMYVGNGAVIHSKGDVGVEKKTLKDWLDIPVAGGKYKDFFVGFGRVKQTAPLPAQPVASTPSVETPQPEEEPTQNTILELIEEYAGKFESMLYSIYGKIEGFMSPVISTAGESVILFLGYALTGLIAFFLVRFIAHVFLHSKSILLKALSIVTPVFMLLVLYYLYEEGGMMGICGGVLGVIIGFFFIVGR
jgi:hypothetical protein